MFVPSPNDALTSFEVSSSKISIFPVKLFLCTVTIFSDWSKLYPSPAFTSFNLNIILLFPGILFIYICPSSFVISLIVKFSPLSALTLILYVDPFIDTPSYFFVNCRLYNFPPFAFCDNKSILAFVLFDSISLTKLEPFVILTFVISSLLFKVTYIFTIVVDLLYPFGAEISSNLYKYSFSSSVELVSIPSISADNTNLPFSSVVSVCVCFPSY